MILIVFGTCGDTPVSINVRKIAANAVAIVARIAARGPYTVRECLEEYLVWLQAHRKTGYDARHRVHTHIVPQLGDIQCDRLTTAEIQRWLRDLAAREGAKRVRGLGRVTGGPVAFGGPRQHDC